VLSLQPVGESSGASGSGELHQGAA
jgi:hypothetical protein